MLGAKTPRESSPNITTAPEKAIIYKYYLSFSFPKLSMGPSGKGHNSQSEKDAILKKKKKLRSSFFDLHNVDLKFFLNFSFKGMHLAQSQKGYDFNQPCASYFGSSSNYTCPPLCKESTHASSEWGVRGIASHHILQQMKPTLQISICYYFFSLTLSSYSAFR